MVETPLRRSRRIKTQSDDESSVASSTRSTRSRGSRAARGSNASDSVTTPTRRSTRATRATSEEAAEKELEAIPESVVENDTAVAAATPAKSTKKKKKTKATPLKATKEVKAEEIKEDEKVSGVAPESVNVDINVEARPVKSAAKLARKKFVAATPVKSAKKQNKKDATVGDSKTAEDTKVDSGATDSNASTPVMVSSPKKSTSSQKKKRNKRSLDAEDAAALSSTQPSTPKSIGKRAAESKIDVPTLAPPSTKSSKKKKVSSPKPVEKKPVEKKAVESNADISTLATSLTKSTKPIKSSKKKIAPSPKSVESDAADSKVDTSTLTPAPTESSKKKKRSRKSLAAEEAAALSSVQHSTPKSTAKEANGPTADISLLTPPLTKSTKKKKRSKKSLDAEEAAALSSVQPSTPKSSIKEANGPIADISLSTPPLTKSTKKKKRSRNSLDAEEAVALSSVQPSTPKSTEKEAKEPESEISLSNPPSTKSTKKKKRSKKSLDAEEAAALSSVQPSTPKSDVSALTPLTTKSTKKKDKRSKKPLDAEEAAAPSSVRASTPKTVGQTDKPACTPPETLKASGKKSAKKNYKRKPDETKKKRIRNATDTEPDDSSKNTDAASVKKLRARKLNTTEELNFTEKDSKDEAADDPSAEPCPQPTKKKKKKKESSRNGRVKRDKTSLKKKHQSLKHARPTVSSKRKLLPKSSGEKAKLVMDVKVHRLRFLKLQQKSILSMSCTPLDSHSSGNPSPVRLAIAREGGAVDLVSPQDRWVSVGDVPGVRGREVDALVWVCRKRGEISDKKLESPLSSQPSHSMRLLDEQRCLFGCSRDGTIFEVDFATKRQKGVIGSGGGGVFCLASMYKGGSGGDGGGYFAAGCEDGSVKIYTASSGTEGGSTSGKPQLVATLPSAGSAILSLAWVPGQSDNDDGGMGGSVIFAGVADGTIRRFDCATSIVAGPISTGTVLTLSRGSTSKSYRWKSTLRMTVENRGLREPTQVWALEALSDGTVISGDSLGHIQIWDGMSGTMTQTFDHNENDADVLCLAVSADENKIFASGIDSSVRCIQRQCLPPTADRSEKTTFEPNPVRKWISSNSHRKHSHDVKALAICHKQISTSAKTLELLVSGSVDTRICTYGTQDFKSSRPKIWYNWPSLSPITVSRKQRLLAVTRDSSIDLYRVNNSEMADPLKNMNPEIRDETKCLVKTISINSPFNLSCSVISDDGNFLAASDAVSLYLFSLEVEEENGMLDVHPTKLVLSKNCKHPATAMKFGDRGRLICATHNGLINIVMISPASGTDSPNGSLYTVSLEHVFKEHMVNWSAASHHFPILSLDLSSDGKWLAARRFSSGKGAVHIFTLPSNDEDGSYQHWWSVPEMDAPTTCIKFLGGGSVEPSLAVGCSNNEFYIYNLGRRSLSHWSNDMGLPLLKSLPKELTTRSEPVTRIVPNPVSPQRFILGSRGYFCVVDLDQPVPKSSSMFPPDHLRAKRLEMIKEDDAMMHLPPKRNQTSCASTNFTICLRYSEMLFQDFLSDNEMIIVEEPWMSILEELPDALSRRVYGT